MLNAPENTAVDNEKLNSEVKDAIMAIVESFLESTNIEIGVNDID